MRKITKQAQTQFASDAPVNWHEANTQVTSNVSTDIQKLLTLHATPIAWRKRNTGYKLPLNQYAEICFVSLEGWNTPTTRERLNELLGCVQVCQRKGKPMLNGQPIREDLDYPAAVRTIDGAWLPMNPLTWDVLSSDSRI